MRATAVLVTLPLAGGLLAGCGGHDTIAGRPHPGTATATPGADGVQEVRVSSDETFRFRPSTIVAEPGRLRIVLRNDGPTRHDLEVPALHASTGAVLAGTVGEVVVTLDRPGRYEFHCTYHERQDMTGTLVVR